MINILKLRKLEKENKQRKLQEDKPEMGDPIKEETISEPQPTASVKPSGKVKKLKADKKIVKPIKLNPEEESINQSELAREAGDRNSVDEKVSEIQTELKEDIFIIQDNNDSGSEKDIEDNPVEAFRQNLLRELLNSDSLPEFSNSEFLKADEIKETLSLHIPEPSKQIETLSEENNTQTSESISHDFVSGTDEQQTDSSEKLVPERIPEVNTGQPEYVNNEIEKSKKNHDSLVHLVSFSLGKENYGVDIMRIREIIRTVEITKVPRAPEFIEGVINLRGSVIPVVNLRTRIKLPRKEYDKSTRIIVLELKEVIIGFIVDEVKEVLRIPQSVIAPPPVLTVGKNVEYITAVAKLENCLIILIEPERLLSGTELEKLK